MQFPTALFYWVMRIPIRIISLVDAPTLTPDRDSEPRLLKSAVRKPLHPKKNRPLRGKKIVK